MQNKRELSQKEIALIRKINALGPEIEDVLLEVKHHLDNASTEDMERHMEATPYRFLSLAKTQLQTGIMYLTRAVEQPTSF